MTTAKAYKKAIDEITQAIELNPYNAPYYRDRAFCYVNLEQYKEALKDINKAIELAPNEAIYYFGKADIYSRLGQYQKSINIYSAFIEGLDEYDYYLLKAYLKRIDCYVDIKDYKSAMSDCRYLLDNQELFSPVAEYDTFIKVENAYYDLKQLTESNEYDDSENYDEEDNEECFSHMKKALFLFEKSINSPNKNLGIDASIEIAKAYIANKEFVETFVGRAQKELKDDLSITLMLLIDIGLTFIKEMEDSGYNSDEILEYFEELKDSDYTSNEILECLEELKKNQNQTNISALHHNPKQGRKLDL